MLCNYDNYASFKRNSFQHHSCSNKPLCLPVLNQWLLVAFFFIQILDIYNCIVSYIGISTKFQLIMIQQNQKYFLKGVLYATVKTSLVSKFGKHTVIDQNPNNIDLSTKNKVHASLVLLSNQKITCMQALVQSCRQTVRKRETLWLHFTKELNMIKS